MFKLISCGNNVQFEIVVTDSKKGLVNNCYMLYTGSCV